MTPDGRQVRHDCKKKNIFISNLRLGLNIVLTYFTNE